MKLRISFDDPPPVDLDVIDTELLRQRALLEVALVALGEGDTETVRQCVNKMDTP